LITDLSRIRHSFVISRHRIHVRNKPVDTRQIGRELGVRYLPCNPILETAH
jgi:TolB-like protein